MRTQTRGHPGTFSIYRVGIVNRRSRNLSNGLDNALIQQKVSVYDLGAILLPCPDCCVSNNGGWRPFLKPVRYASFEEIGRRARSRFESGTSHEDLLGIKRYPLGG